MNPNNPTSGDDRHLFGYMGSTGRTNCICGWSSPASNRAEAAKAWRRHTTSLSLVSEQDSDVEFADRRSDLAKDDEAANG